MQTPLRKILQKKVSLFRGAHVPADLRLLQRFLTLVEENFRVKKEPDFYAEELEISIWKLGYLLKVHCNTSFSQVMHQRQRQEAELLLRQSALSIKEVAFELGLADPSYFCRYFKKATGLTPREYRHVRQG